MGAPFNMHCDINFERHWDLFYIYNISCISIVPSHLQGNRESFENFTVGSLWKYQRLLLVRSCAILYFSSHSSHGQARKNKKQFWHANLIEIFLVLLHHKSATTYPFCPFSCSQSSSMATRRAKHAGSWYSSNGKTKNSRTLFGSEMIFFLCAGSNSVARYLCCVSKQFVT